MREAAGAILRSQTFSRSARLRAFLEHVVETAAEGRGEEINEYSLGIQVFGKAADFSPNEDNIVRVTARQLRIKLEEYYHGEGRQDPWRLEIAKGGYVPALQPNEPAAASPDPAARRRRWTRAAAAVVALSGWAVALGLWSQAPRATPQPAYLLEPLFHDPSLPILFVAEDPLLPMSWAAAPEFPSLEQFLNGYHRYPEGYAEGLRRALYPVGSENSLVRVSAMQLLTQLQTIAATRGVRVRGTNWREIRANDLAEAHVILTGGLGANPWVEAFQKNLAFEHRIEPLKQRRYFLNRQPREGEPESFESAGLSGEKLSFHTRVAVAPNPYGRGKVALMGGVSRQSTEGAWQFMLSARGVDEIRQRCGMPPERLAGFEAILETGAIGLTPMTWTVRALRCGPPAE